MKGSDSKQLDVNAREVDSILCGFGFDVLNTCTTVVCDLLRVIFSGVGEQQVSETGTNPAPWSTDEQKLLEQALRTYPANTPERWEKIAEVLPARSKKDCMKRYKVS